MFVSGEHLIMNKSTNSSFAPLEYYKKLTNCLANRKNLKLNISKIQGSREYRIKPSPFVTNRKIQVKFLANYRLRKQFNENQKQQREKLGYHNEAIFNLNSKSKALNEKLKRKTSQESYINLPDTYFKSDKVPDLSLFKVPGLPPIKRHKFEILPNTVNVNNFTLASLFSGNFKPQICSTPIENTNKSIDEQPQPIIADPNDILGPYKDDEEKETANDPAETSSDFEELRTFEKLIDEAASYINSVYFDDSQDLVSEIIKILSRKHETSSQSPRPSLISDLGVCSLKNSKIDSKKPLWPVPTFYEQSNNKTVTDTTFNDNNDINTLFEDTKNLFSFLDEEETLDQCTTAFKFDESPKKSETCFFNDVQNSADNTFSASSQYTLTPYPDTINKDCDDINWLENRFSTSMDMSWETESNSSISSTNNNFQSDFSAVFRSPPKKNSLETKKTFSRTIERPKYRTLTCSDSGRYSYKSEDFSWWFGNDNYDSTSNNSFMSHNDTQILFDNNFSLF